MPSSGMANEVFHAQAVPNIITSPPPPTPLSFNVTPINLGSQSDRTERIIVTAVNGYGESANSKEATFKVEDHKVLLITPTFNEQGNAPGGPIGWNCYMTTGRSGTETKQNTALLSLGSSFQEPATGLITGSALPNNVVASSSFVQNPSNVTHIPPVTGIITVAQSPAGTSNTNTGRNNTATVSFMTKSLNALNVGTTPGKAKNIG